MRRVAIVQARMTSGRLPGKVLMDIAGRPMLAHVVDRLRRCARLDDVVVAVTDNPEDDPLVRAVDGLDARWYRGSEHDVLGRYAGAAREAEAELVVRVTSDCPLLDPVETDAVIAAIEQRRDSCDYASNRLEPHLPRGLDAEALWRDVLDRTDRLATSAPAREHVTWFCYAERPDLFALHSVRRPVDAHDLRWTVDTADDLSMVRRLYADLGLARAPAPAGGGHRARARPPRDRGDQRPRGAEGPRAVSAGPLLLFRADASPAIGLGHALRCLALTQALADERDGRAVFLMHRPPQAFLDRAERESIAVEALRAPPGSPADAGETADLARERGAAWVVVDGYHFDAGFQRVIVDAGLRLLAFDDYGHADAYHADLVLNQNLGADAATYAGRVPAGRLLLGPSFALLRREFRAWHEPPRAVAQIGRRVLVTLGGSDPDNVTALVLAGLEELPGPLDVTVLVGGANPHRADLARAASASRHTVELVVDALDMPVRMAWADLAVAAAGGTSWELARIGTPQLAITLAENQRPAGRALAANGAAVGLGWHEDLTPAAVGAAVAELAAEPERRAELAARGRALIDGDGARRVLTAMGLAVPEPAR